MMYTSDVAKLDSDARWVSTVTTRGDIIARVEVENLPTTDDCDDQDVVSLCVRPERSVSEL
jgi:hypothetical protein